MTSPLGVLTFALKVAVGGGGLIAGVSAYVKAIWPETKIIGVEPEDACAMTLSIKANKPVELESVGLFADGVAVRKVGENTFSICKKHVDEMITVNTSETLLVAYNRMRASDISQIPVLSDGKLVGVLDEEDLLFSVSKEPSKFSDNVALHMIDRLDTLQCDASKDELLAILSEGKVAIVYKGETFIGFVTKVDLINFYRNKLN